MNTSIRGADWQTKNVGKKDKKGLTDYSAGIDTLKDFLKLDVWMKLQLKIELIFFSAKLEMFGSKRVGPAK